MARLAFLFTCYKTAVANKCEMRKKSEVHGLRELVPAVRRIHDEGPCNLSSGLNRVHIVLGFTFNMCEDVSNVKFKAENKYEEMQQLRIPHLIRYRAVTTCAPACLSATCTPLFRSFLLLSLLEDNR